jgi:hypothetical protein
VLWGLAVHDKSAGDEPFLNGLLLVERAASDERHLVKKAVGRGEESENGSSVASTGP